MSDASGMARETITLAGIEIELHEGGSGPPLLFLHGASGFTPDPPYVGLLAQRRRLIAPSHPGFGASGLPLWLDTIDDIAHLYLELMDRRGLARVDVVGTSLGGWLAAEIATKVPERIGKLVLVGPVGVKLGPPDKLDIPDVFAMAQDKVMRLIYHDVDKGKVDFSKMTDAAAHGVCAQPRDHGAAYLGAVDAQSEAPPSPASHRVADTVHSRRQRRPGQRGLRRWLRQAHSQRAGDDDR